MAAWWRWRAPQTLSAAAQKIADQDTIKRGWLRVGDVCWRVNTFEFLNNTRDWRRSA
jgi:hypothetical protein